MQPRSARLVLGLSYLTYLFFGMFTAAVGPTLGELAQRTGASLASIGGAITSLFLGSVIAQVFGGALNDRFGYKPVLLVSMTMLSVGIAAFTSARLLPLMLGLALFTGLGQGGVDMGANLVVADAAPGRVTPALNLLHFFFGLGAFIGPALVGLAIMVSGMGLTVLWIIAGLFMLLTIAMAFLLEGGRSGASDASSATADLPGGLSVYASPALWLMGALMLIYVGVEIGLGSWISSYLGLSTGMLPQYGALVTSAYWAAIALGRLAGAAASRHMTRLRLLTVALVGSFLGSLGLLFSHGLVVATIVCLVWIAFSYGTVYPTTVALAASVFVRNTGKAVGVLVALGSIGAAALPLLAGQLLESETHRYLWFVVVGLALLPALLAAIGRLAPAERA